MNPIPFKFRSRSIAWIAIALPVVALMIGSIDPIAFSEAKDPAVLRPRTVTSFEEVREGNVVRRVPVTSTVYEQHDVQVFQNVAAAVNPLPHEREIHSLVQEILGSTGPNGFRTPDGQPEETPDNEQLKTQLQGMLGDQFDAMGQRQQDQIKELSERLEKLKSQHQARFDARDEIISRRMNELLRRPDPLAWDPYADQRYKVTTLTVPQQPYVDSVRAGSPVGVGSSPAFAPQALTENYNQSRSVFQPTQPSLPPALIPTDGNAWSPKSAAVPTERDIINSLYAALGRWSVDQSAEARNQLRSALESAQRQLQHLRMSPPSPLQPTGDRQKIAEQIKAIEMILQSPTVETSPLPQPLPTTSSDTVESLERTPTRSN